MVLRVAFWFTALLFLLLGLTLYWLPQPQLPGAVPLWLARSIGALLTAWGLGLLYSGYRTDPTGRVLLVAGNLLITATLGAAALKLDLPMLRPLLLGVAGFLLVTGLVGLVAAAPVRKAVPLAETRDGEKL